MAQARVRTSGSRCISPRSPRTLQGALSRRGRTYHANQSRVYVTHEPLSGEAVKRFVDTTSSTSSVLDLIPLFYLTILGSVEQSVIGERQYKGTDQISCLAVNRFADETTFTPVTFGNPFFTCDLGSIYAYCCQRIDRSSDRCPPAEWPATQPP